MTSAQQNKGHPIMASGNRPKKEIDYGCWENRDDLINAIRHENKLMNKKFKFEKPKNLKSRNNDEQ